MVNTARSRLRRVAREPIPGPPAGLGALELFVGTGEGIDPRSHHRASRALRHLADRGVFPRRISRCTAISRARSPAPATGSSSSSRSRCRSTKAARASPRAASRAVDEAITRAFERFMLEDALFDRELPPRASIIASPASSTGSVQAALGGEPAPVLPETPSVDASAPTVRGPGEATPAPTVAAPEEVVRFAATLLETRAFEVLVYDARLRETRHRITLREVLGAHRGGVLRRMGNPVAPGILYLNPRDPLADALVRRLALTRSPRSPRPPTTRRPRAARVAPRCSASRAPRSSRSRVRFEVSPRSRVRSPR